MEVALLQYYLFSYFHFVYQEMLSDMFFRPFYADHGHVL
jgi:hypothetical protein